MWLSWTQMVRDITGIDLFDQNADTACGQDRLRCT